MAPKITLYFLQASRSVRPAWLLEELGLDYDVVFAPRENGAAPQWLKDEAGGLGKFPCLRDGDQMFYESGNITEYDE
jgi:glutathione S-transferase